MGTKLSAEVWLYKMHINNTPPALQYSVQFAAHKILSKLEHLNNFLRIKCMIIIWFYFT